MSLTVPGFTVLCGRHAAASVIPRHTHDDPTICCVARGRFREHYVGKAVDCDERMVKVTPAGDPHWNRFDAVETRGIRIDVDRRRFDDAGAIRALLEDRRFFQAAIFTVWTRRLLDELGKPDAAAPVAVESLLLELVVRLARLPIQDGGAPPAWLLRAQQVVHDSYRSALTLADVAAEVGVHPATLARAYRRTYGATVGERIRELRVEHAARELATTDAPLAEIALRAGFYDQSHFTNVFRRGRHVTPAQYRALHGGRSEAPPGARRGD